MEFYKKDPESNQVIIFENVVYDVKEYMPEHPGGADYIGNLLGKNIDDDFIAFAVGMAAFAIWFWFWMVVMK